MVATRIRVAVLLRVGLRALPGGIRAAAVAVMPRGSIFQLLLLCFQYPALGVPLVIIVVVFFVAKAAVGASQKGWSTSTPVQSVEGSARVPRSELDAIRTLDPGFSLVLFEDFAYMLYAAVSADAALARKRLLPTWSRG